jgi:hypothetical protein
MASSIFDEFLCPITLEIMNDPVICEDGYTYERSVIMSIQNSISPITGQPIDKSRLIPNRALKSVIDRFLSLDPQHQDIILERINNNDHDVEFKAQLDLERKQKGYKLCKFKKEIKQLCNYYLKMFLLFVLVWMISYLIILIYLNMTNSMFILMIIVMFIV